MLRNFIQAVGHYLSAPFGYDLCVESFIDREGNVKSRFKLSKLEIQKETRHTVQWKDKQGLAYCNNCESYTAAKVEASVLAAEGQPVIEIWQEEKVNRLMSRRTRVHN